MPNRIIREGILTSDRINELSLGAEIFYRRLMSVVDDFGRFSAKLTLLRASCYPLRVDLVHEEEISSYLDECVKAKLIAHYDVGGKHFLQMEDFRQQVRAKESKCPAPDSGTPIICKAPAAHVISDATQINKEVIENNTLTSLHGDCLADAQHMKSFAHLDVDVDGVVFEDVRTASHAHTHTREKAGKPKPAALLSKAMMDFGIVSNPGDPRIISLAEQGVSPETITAACEEAKRQHPDERISTGFIIAIVERWAKKAAAVKVNGAKPPEASAQQPQAKSAIPSDRSWTDPGLEARGKALKLTPKPGESRNDFDDRIASTERTKTDGEESWAVSKQSIEAKAKELGCWPPKPGEKFRELTQRIKEKLTSATS